QSTAFYKSWQRKLLVNEINAKMKTKTDLTSVLTTIEPDLRSRISPLDFSSTTRYVANLTDEFRSATLRTHSRTLFNLGIDCNVHPLDPNKVIFNYSSTIVPDRVKFLLAFGLDFCLPVYRMDFYSYFLAFEKIFLVLKDRSREVIPEFTDQLRSIASKYYYNFSPQKIFSSCISKSDIHLLKQFGQYKNIIVSQPDKGHGVVIVDKNKYIESMTAIISDRSKFQLISEPIHSYTLKIEDKINNFLRKLKDLKMLSADNYSKIFVSGSGPGKLYGLPKIHKSNFSTMFQFRPTFAAYNTPGFSVAKFLVPILNPISRNEFTLENSHSFVNDLSRISNASKCFMTSFDIENLFTNIPLKKTIDICLLQLFTDPNSLFMGLSRKFFKT
ncbi:hypothetical protein FHG87_021527, partial [Trinorchestia longiramus]